MKKELTVEGISRQRKATCVKTLEQEEISKNAVPKGQCSWSKDEL